MRACVRACVRACQISTHSDTPHYASSSVCSPDQMSKCNNPVGKQNVGGLGLKNETCVCMCCETKRRREKEKEREGERGERERVCV